MRLKLRDYFSLAALKHLAYTPLIILNIKNWFSFLLNHVGLSNVGKTILFRNGLKIKTKEGIDTTTIAVIFFHKDYGLVKNNSTIIDIGANIGIYSLFAASTSKNTFVYAYEPTPKSYNLLENNIKINKLTKKILPFNFGISAKREKRKIFYGKSSPYNSLYNQNGSDNYITINCIPLQDIFLKNKIDQCTLLKMDCEGAEFEIIYSTPDLIFKKIKEIRLEYHNLDANKNNINYLKNFLKKQGFQITRFRKDSNSLGNVWFKNNILSKQSIDKW